MCCYDNAWTGRTVRLLWGGTRRGNGCCAIVSRSVQSNEISVSDHSTWIACDQCKIAVLVSSVPLNDVQNLSHNKVGAGGPESG